MSSLRTAVSATRIAPVFALCLLLMACAGSGSEEASGIEASQAQPQPDTSTVVPDAAAETSGDSGGEERVTLDDFVGQARRAPQGFGAGFATFDDDAITQEQQQIQQEIQRCMQAQGFVYVPEDVGDGLRTFLETQNQSLSPEEYAATEGFGLSTRFDAILDGEFEFDDDTNPNDEHLATLSQGEADAWEFALQGEPPQRNEQGQLIDPSTGEVIGRNGPGQATGGCRLEAQTAVRGETVELGELEDALAVLDERIDSDPRIVEIRRAWADCMAAEGFDYTSESEARDDINSQFRPLIVSFFASANVAGEGGLGQGGLGRGGGGNLAQVVAGMQLTDEQEVELEALQERERAVAVASLTCEGDTGAEVDEITARYEAEFVEANRAALEALNP